MANSNVNWMVPLRRAVVKGKGLSYRAFLKEWVKQLRDSDNSFVLAFWYRDPEKSDFSVPDYERAVGALGRWIKGTFEEREVATSPVGITTLQTRVPNFHCRLWKGPKRVLREQAAGDDEAKRAEIQPFLLVDGRIELRLDERGKPQDFPLLPGDVLEVPLHEFLLACGQERFEDIEFDPQGSFYLGTTVRSKSGRKRVELPLLHDNMLAMRFQLLTALNMANCYHDKPVYTRLSVPAHALKPEGAGVFARGMPFGGNPASLIQEDTDPPHWRITQYNTNQPRVDRPIYVPSWKGLNSYARGQPITWGWTCSPFALFFFTFMADAHQTSDGIVLPDELRKGSLAQSICLSTNSKTNADHLKTLTSFQAKKHPGNPLLLHNLQASDIFLPREQTPLADLCEIVLPEGKEPQRDRFSDPNGDRIRRIPLPAKDQVDTYEWDQICPGAGVIVQSSGAGHEFGLVRLYPLTKILTDATEALAAGVDPMTLPLPIAGRLGAYNPLSGEDYCADKAVGPEGLFFSNESAARMPPSTGRSHYTRHMAMADVNIHRFRFTRKNIVQFMAEGTSLLINDGHEDASTLSKKKQKDSFRKRAVSGIYYIAEGSETDPNPRTLCNIYRIPRESWSAIVLRPADGEASKDTTAFLANFQRLYAERAVPFPTLREAAPSLPSWERVFEQLENHRDRILQLPNQVATLEAALNKRLAQIDAENATKPKEKKTNPNKDPKVKDLRSELKLAKDTTVRQAFLDHLPPKKEDP